MNRNYIVGTAGHIDHGKTSLTKALTGKDTDRLKEEKERNISIELGFAPFMLPNGDEVSLIDVPGHEKFIRHMVAGVGGIDLVLLVIALNEGIMPQTREHLHIIELLGIEKGIIVLTKKDLVDDEFHQFVEEDVKDYLKDSKLKDAPIISVSTVTNEGIAELKTLIIEQLEQIPERKANGYFRMPIDRVFTLKGIGTVITGTVYSGMVEVGDELTIMPSDIPVKVRSLQVHSKIVNSAYAGQRVAINTTGVELSDIKRGDSIVTPNQMEPSKRIDIELNILENIDFTIKHNSEVKILIGTSEVLGKIIFYDRKEAKANEHIYCQIILEESIISARKEKIIIRRPSPAITIGGGVVIEPNAKKHKFNQETINSLKQKQKGTIEELIYDSLLTGNILITVKELSDILILPEEEAVKKAENLINQDKIVRFKQGNMPFYVAKVRFNQLEKSINNHLTQYHTNNPMKIGEAKTEIIKLFFTNIKPKLVQEILLYWENKKLIKLNDEYVSNYSFKPSLPKGLEAKAYAIEAKLKTQGFSPDSWDMLAKEEKLTEKNSIDLYKFFIDQDVVFKISDNYVIHHETYRQLKNLITQYLLTNQKISLQESKELLQVSRKYLVPLMELLDQKKVTALRDGHNYRELRRL